MFDHTQFDIQPVVKGHYSANIAKTKEEILALQRLRHTCFRGGDGVDADHFDDQALHVAVYKAGGLAAGYRLFIAPKGPDILAGYSAQFYDLSALARHRGPMVEMGRFCVAAEHHDPNLLRLAWGLLAQIVDALKARFLVGCVSFQGGDIGPYRQALDALMQAYPAPLSWAARPKGEKAVLPGPPVGEIDMKQALGQMPPLLRSYVMMGARVSDHVVMDPDLNTFHLFAVVEIDKIPPARLRVLRDMA